MQCNLPTLRNIGIDLLAKALTNCSLDYPVERIHGCTHRFLADYDLWGMELLYCDPPTSNPPEAPTAAIATTM